MALYMKKQQDGMLTVWYSFLELSKEMNGGSVIAEIISCKYLIKLNHKT